MKKLVLIIGLILGLSAMAENNTTKVNIKKAEETVKSDVKKDFEKIPGSPIAYWVSDKIREIFEKNKKLENYNIKII